MKTNWANQETGFSRYITKTIIKFEKDIMISNFVTKFHKVVVKITGLLDRTPTKMVNLHEQRAITLKCMI